MRFPWLQVDSDFIAAHAADLAAHLDITRREAIGLAVDLWTWALARSSDDAPPDGVVTGTGPVPDRLLAGSVGWTGPVSQLVDGLVAVGLMVKIAAGYRVVGIDRYKATWEKNRRRTGEKPEKNRSGTGPVPTRKTQTHTQIEATTLAGASRSAPEQASPPSEEHVLPVPTSGRQDKPASPTQQPLQAAEVVAGSANGADPETTKPTRKTRQKAGQEPQDTTAFVACRDMLVAVYEQVRGTKYGFEGAKDARAVGRLLELSGGDVAEVERRWRQALGIQAGYLRANGIAHFTSNWNAYPGASATGGFRPQDRGGRATHADRDWKTYNGEPF